MANNIQAETPLENELLLWCEVFKKSTDGNGDVVETPVVGATDVKAFFSTVQVLHTAYASLIGTLEVTLNNVAGTNRYWNTIAGASITSGLQAHNNAEVHVHFVKGDGEWHEVASTTVRDTKLLTGDDLALVIPLDNNLLIRVALLRTVVNPTTGDLEPDTPWVPGADVDAFLSASNSLASGTAVHADLAKTLTQVGSLHVFSDAILGAELSDHLTGLIGDNAHLHIKRGSDFHATHQALVSDLRVAA